MLTLSVKRKVALALFAAVAALAGLGLASRSHAYQRARFAVWEWWHAVEGMDRSLWLPAYRVVREAQPVAGVEKNLSGLTWNPDTQTLFAVVNSPPLVVELSPEGETRRIIPLVGINDPEAIEYIDGGRYVIAAERTQKIVAVDIGAETAELSAADAERLTLGEGLISNQGLEGLAWDASARILYAAKERDPLHIFEVSGFPPAPGAPMNIEVAGSLERDAFLFVADVAGLAFAPRYRHLLVLSEESKLLLELDRDGRPIGSLSLAKGHGLARPVPQPEGVALDEKGTLYLVSEPNLFYVFRKPAP